MDGKHGILGVQVGGRLAHRLRTLVFPSLMIVDEMGYLPITRTGAICDEVRASPGQVTIVCLGPLTNLARALQREADLAPLIQVRKG